MHEVKSYKLSKCEASSVNFKAVVFAIGYMRDQPNQLNRKQREKNDSFKDVPPLNLVQALQACVMCLSAELLPHAKQRWI